MDDLTLLIQKSANLCKFLMTLPPEENREEYIGKIHVFLDERGEIIQNLQHAGFQYDQSNNQHKLLYELDLNINVYLQKVMDEIKKDLKELQETKKKEIQYINPYKDVYNQEGRYYDGKK